MITKRAFCVLLLLLTTFAWQQLQSQTLTFVEHDISKGDLVIKGSANTKNYHVTGSTDEYKILIGRGYTGTIKLTDVTITSSVSRNIYGATLPTGASGTIFTGSAMTLIGVKELDENVNANLNPETKVNLVLEGDNALTFAGKGYYCGIEVQQGAQIHISAIDPNDNASGVLEAKSTTIVPGSGEKPFDGGAGIGARNYSSDEGRAIIEGIEGTADKDVVGTIGNTAGGNILVSSGTITAWGGHGAGIGGGFKTYYNGIIAIYGGIVESRGGYDSSGIGSGCPAGTGVLGTYAPLSSIVVLPPARIESYGAGASADQPSTYPPVGGVGVVQNSWLGLAGAKNIIYINDPNKPEVTVRTEDNQPGANIYLDLTQVTDVVDAFNNFSIEYDLSAIKLGATDLVGLYKFHAQIDNLVTFYTDATSKDPATYGRFYLPVETDIPPTPMEQEVVLSPFDVDMSIEIFPVYPLPVGYTEEMAGKNAYCAKIVYNDNNSLSDIIFDLQNETLLGASPFMDPIFLAADSSRVISTPTTLSKGDVIYIILPLRTGHPEGTYSDVFRFTGTWQSGTTGWIRMLPEQRVGYKGNDLVTTFEYGSVHISILDNDSLTSGVIGGITSALNLVTEQPKAGILTGNGLDIVYTHMKSSLLEHEIDSFTYRINAGGIHDEAKVYIYVIRSTNESFGTCKDNDYTIDLLPATGVDYTWYTTYDFFVQSGLSYSIPNIQDDVRLKVAPVRTAEPYKNLKFPSAPLLAKVVNPDGSPATMRWTGFLNTDWHNPANWVSVNGNIESPVTWIPTPCVDVIIPSGTPNYPELNAPAVCANITVEDRAMIAGVPWHLTYDSAKVDLVLTPQEKNRFVMWSAPLKDTYSGDYHYKKQGTDEPVWGDVFMNFFQMENPDYPNSTTVAQRTNTFTATFGNVWTPLPLGVPFNLSVQSTAANNSKAFQFPQLRETYRDSKGNTSPGSNTVTKVLKRNSAHRFVTDDLIATSAPWGTTEHISQAVIPSDIPESEFIQLVNPFLAYLDVNKFLSLGQGYHANFAFMSDVRIWDGNVNGGFVTILPNADPSAGEGRYSFKTDQWDNAPQKQYIPPLQSFIVKKKTHSGYTYDYSNPSQVAIYFTSDMFTTNIGEDSYLLRSEFQETGVLRVRATQGESNSSIALYYEPEASPYYKSEEDALKLFFDEFSLDLYSLTDQKKPLSINTSGNFVEVPLGLKIKNAGSVTLDFSGMETFGHKVYLIDKELKGPIQITDLQVSPTYKFAVTKPNTELNDRFLLRMDYTGIGLSNEQVEASDFSVYAEEGYIYVQSGSSAISGVQVYTISGATVYSNSSQSYRLRIPADGGQTYIVKAIINGESKVRKVFVK